MRNVDLVLLTASILAGVSACSTDATTEPRTELAASPIGPVIPGLQSCDITYSAPGAWPPIDPVGLLAGAASDCSVGTNASPCAPHHVYTPNPAREREPLFVFLPGTNMEPDKHDLVLLTAASAGYRTIGLSYDNTVSQSAACAGLDTCGLNCAGLMREEVARGIDLTPQVDVARGDSVLVRLYRVLEHLDSIDPAGGWSSYYVPATGSIRPNNIVWENIILGGFSQGAGELSYISWFQQVHGLFILDGANDTCVDPATGDNVPAEWLTATPDASAGRPKYAFRHDHGTGDTTTTASWQALGLGTTLLDIDMVAQLPPAHASVTAQGHPATPAICSDHMSMGRDDCMPTDLAGATAATVPADYRLFNAYTNGLCYACDAATCP